MANRSRRSKQHEARGRARAGRRAALATAGIVLAGLLLSVVGFRAGWFGAGAPTVAIPAIDVSDRAPLVARALSQARARVVAEPLSAKAWGTLGCVLDAHDDHDAALASYARAAELHPGDFRWVYLQARIHGIRQSPDAIPLLERALKIRPDYAPARVRLGDALLRDNQTAAAKAQYREALRLDSGRPHALLGMSQIALSEQRPDEALAYLRKCKEVRPDWKKLHSLMARILGKKGDRAGARRASARASRLSKDDVIEDPVGAVVQQYGASATSFADRGKHALEEGNLTVAEREFKRALELRPDVALHHFHMGLLRNRQGNTEEAAKWYRQAIKIDPRYASARYNLGLLLLGTGARDEATEQFRRAVEDEPSHAKANFHLGMRRAAAGDLEGATASLRRAVDLWPDNAAFSRNLAAVLQDTGREGEAVNVLSDALGYNPGHRQIAVQLAWLLSTSPDESVRAGERAVMLTDALAGTDAESDMLYLATRAAALAQVGRFEEALSYAEQALTAASDANSPFARQVERLVARLEVGEPFHR